ncbi:MAG: putative HTH-type transcriptional regulator YusO [Pelotomaculum sp. PtaB.Bin013]|uniref:MarR family transcriptional regulator n=1 Tax=Pelotomaculum isophthalicicum JI TaxID=947010 RepID=A0A9X4JWN1_9FIRM|nr:MarR family transcriptional regulator [Pelotomaculum isophthalicicum]MDF9409747.1 MarR family transcriptional regulator [Pelotomaculum isophthalicicum JI]OPX90584.1 MAG: putative HTH-type transcriptional regulator YusO [Pelotomaculum sp. PtaB.Bin013]
MENVAGDFLALMAFIRDKFIRPVELITRSRISHVQFYAISVLRRSGSLSMSELAGEMHISKQQLTPLVYKLIDNGLLARKTDEKDRRIVRIEVTEIGRHMYEEILVEIKLALIKKLGTLPEMELNELEHMLKRTYEIMKSIY